MAKTPRTIYPNKRGNGVLGWQMSVKTRLVLVIGYCLVMCPFMAAGGRFHRACSLSNMPVVAITRDPATGEFVLLDDSNGNDGNNGTADPGDDGVGGSSPGLGPDDNDGTNNQTRRGLLRHGSDTPLDTVPAIYVSSVRVAQQEDQVDSEQVFYVRQCFCFTQSSDKPYCPLDKGACGIVNNNIEATGCFTHNSRTILIRNAWPVIFLWYGALLIYFVFTQQGRNARNFMYRKCCNPTLNQDIIEDMMLRRRASSVFTRRWFPSFWRRSGQRQRRQDALLEELQRATAARELVRMANEGRHEESLVAPTQLELKTRRYVSPDKNNAEESMSIDNNNDMSSNNNETATTLDEDDEEGHGVSCTICFAEIHHGDRIGALTCDHTFHVDCLKVWLTRRNVCPLCQTPNVASPRYQRQEEQDESDGSGAEEDVAPTLDTNEERNATMDPNHEQDTQPAGPSRRWWRGANDNFRGRTILHRRQHHN